MQTLIRILVFEEYGVMSNEPHQRCKIRMLDKTLLPTQIIYIYTRILLLTWVMTTGEGSSFVIPLKQRVFQGSMKLTASSISYK